MTVPATEWKLLLDIFPCEVVMPTQQVERRCRVFVFDDGVVVYGDRGGRPVKLFGERHSAEPELPRRNTPRLRQRAIVHSVQGTIYINRTGGCGCHSPLLQLRPEDARV